MSFQDAFQANAFQADAFQIVGQSPAVASGGSWANIAGPYRRKRTDDAELVVKPQRPQNDQAEQTALAVAMRKAQDLASQAQLEAFADQLAIQARRQQEILNAQEEEELLLLLTLAL